MAKVNVPREVLRGIIAVRDSGITNMFDAPAVERIARQMGYGEAAQWARNHRREYAELMLFGPADEDASQ